MTKAPQATVVLTNAETRERFSHWVRTSPKGTVATLAKPTRTLPQNARLHAHLTDIARQVTWPLEGGSKRTVEAWKDIFTAALRSAKHELDVVPGINGGFVLLGMHTSSMTVEECGELISLIEAWAAQHGVELGEQ